MYLPTFTRPVLYSVLCFVLYFLLFFFFFLFCLFCLFCISGKTPSCASLPRVRTYAFAGWGGRWVCSGEPELQNGLGGYDWWQPVW